MAEVLDWQRGEPQAVMARAAELLAQGHLIALPTDTVYFILAKASLPEAVAQLPATREELTFLVPGAAGLRSWMQEPPGLALRFARRCWPGPLVLILDLPTDLGQARPMPGGTGQLIDQEKVALYAPGHEAPLLLLRDLNFPVVACPVLAAGQPATTAQEVEMALGDRVALILDDGPTQFGQPPTWVQVTNNSWSLVREGVLPLSVLHQVAPSMIVFVCTGNTCRSPLAEHLCKKLLAEQLDCLVQDLPQRGYVVLSAGLAASQGEPATQEAVGSGPGPRGRPGRPPESTVVARSAGRRGSRDRHDAGALARVAAPSG